MIALTLVAGAVGAVLLLPTLTDLLARGRWWLGITRRDAALPFDPPRLLFLVPAHDEELLIEACVRSLLRLRYPADRTTVVVVADNCQDGTAGRARAAGARCLERDDRAAPGKPHAIAWALTRLDWREHDAVVIIDADSEVDPGFATALARRGPLHDRAVQGDHAVLNLEESPWTRLGGLLGAANHQFAYPVKQRGDLNTPLLGNGMSIGRDVLVHHGWPAFTICEDWEMYATLTAAGVRIDGAPDARVASQEARTLGQGASQRRRWTAGKLTVLVRSALPLLRSRRIGWTQKLDALGELAAPGPALHVGIVALGTLALLLAAAPDRGPVITALATSLLRPSGYAGAALARSADPWRTLRAAMFLPGYIVWRVWIAVAALTMVGDRPWIRTTRHVSPGGPKG